MLRKGEPSSSEWSHPPSSSTRRTTRADQCSRGPRSSVESIAQRSKKRSCGSIKSTRLSCRWRRKSSRSARPQGRGLHPMLLALRAFKRSSELKAPRLVRHLRLVQVQRRRLPRSSRGRSTVSRCDLAVLRRRLSRQCLFAKFCDRISEAVLTSALSVLAHRRQFFTGEVRSPFSGVLICAASISKIVRML